MPSDASAPAPRALLQARELTKDFQGLRAVCDVSLSVAEGTVHALVGPHGAGKSTLFNLLTGFLSPTSGQILFRGEDITGRQPEQVARLGIARSFQITSVFEQLSAVDHVELALASPTGLGHPFGRSSSQVRRDRNRNGNRDRDDNRDRALDLLDRVGLADRSGAAAGSLAPRQRRALELALTLALDPQLLLLDEPTAGMGRDDVDRTIALVTKVSEGRTVVVVEHNMRVVAALADTVTVLQSGQVLAEGSYDQVRHDESVVTAYLGQAG